MDNKEYEKEYKNYVDNVVNALIGYDNEKWIKHDTIMCQFCECTKYIEISDYAKSCMFGSLSNKACLQEFIEKNGGWKEEYTENDDFCNKMIEYCKENIKKRLIFYYAELVNKYPKDYKKYRTLIK